MTPRSLFTIIIKVLGIWLGLSSLAVLGAFFPALFFAVNGGGGEDDVLLMVFLLLLGLSVFIFVLWLCLFKTGWIIDKLSLDKHFREEHLNLNLDSFTVLSIACIITGGVMVIDTLPDLCRQLFIYLQYKGISPHIDNSRNLGYILLMAIELMIGYLLISKHRAIVNFIERQSRKES